MNKKQWFVFGIGLIILGVFIGVVSGIDDCSELNDANLKLMAEGDSTLEARAISCMDRSTYSSLISTIIFSIGILFVICGFLEPKKKGAK